MKIPIAKADAMAKKGALNTIHNLMHE